MLPRTVRPDVTVRPGVRVPPSARYRPDPRHGTLGGAFFDVVAPARFPDHRLRWRNDRAAAEIGLDTLDDAAWVDHLARFVPLPHNLPAPLALRYHGHQFRSYNPDLGDGRGFLYAQVRDDRGRLLDLGTKGSGTTPWSRGGDGRLTLKGGVRELLATELLDALGVPTSRTLSLVETGESLQRHDEPSPTRACVLVRLQWSHVRFGTFQRLAATGDHDSLRRLVTYCLDTYLDPQGPAASGRAPHVDLLAQVAHRSARLAAAWMNAGFVHGVLNTDNMNLTGESFDYGPWRFTPTFNPRFTAAYFDHDGLYAFGRQPEAVLWNLGRLADALSVLGETEAIVSALDGFVEDFRAAWRSGLLRRLGVAPVDPTTDAARVSDVVAFLATPAEDGLRPGFEQTLFDWFGGAAAGDRPGSSPQAARYDAAGFAAVRAWLPSATPADGYGPDDPLSDRHGPCTLHIDEVEALWAPIADADDWAPLFDKVADIRRYGRALAPVLTPPAARTA
ncbi:MAG: YdiU family protein [Alphaproteobacteria bacterium]|nr:YdiU family protein [Alphaproteobacteria bacterium]